MLERNLTVIPAKGVGGVSDRLRSAAGTTCACLRECVLQGGTQTPNVLPLYSVLTRAMLALCSELRYGYCPDWIPAFAGMTVFFQGDRSIPNTFEENNFRVVIIKIFNRSATRKTGFFEQANRGDV
jgi:hypothetical protein